MTILGDMLSTLMERRYAFRPRRSRRPMQTLLDSLLGSLGDVSGSSLAAEILDTYGAMDEAGRAEFFELLLTRYGLDEDALGTALAGWRAKADGASYRALQQAAEPRRQEIARRLNQLPGATGRLVDMRADLLRLLPERPELGPVDEDLRHLFRSWFNRGFLVLRPISWHTPADILERIIGYEAVHSIGSWQELRQRLEPEDRRCFAFFHPAMPDDPLIFVQVALTRGIPGAIGPLLAPDSAPLPAEEADTAVFYSISNCQKGLAGISFGDILIKQVVERLSLELRELQTFVTLSPIPGFTRWLERVGLEPQALAPDSHEALAAQYLLEARRPDGRPLDPVARFHLRNGAEVHKVHPGADASARGQAQSLGAMVNYLYDPRRIVERHQRFAEDGEIAAARAVVQAAKKGAALLPRAEAKAKA
ncbi:MAG: malonyl-CoA decarboxylase [Paracoccaceae bacterium]